MIIPKENEKDLEEIPTAVKRKLEFVPVEHMDEVLRVALAEKSAEAPDITPPGVLQHEPPTMPIQDGGLPT